MNNTAFIFDGVNSLDKGLHIIKINDGIFSSPYISRQNIIEEQMPKKHIPIYYTVQKQSFEFEVIFSLLDEEFTPENKYDLARWLIQDEYKEFISTDYVGKIFYVIATNQADFMSGGNNKGYFSLNFRTNAPWAYSPVEIQTYDLSAITIPTTIQIENKSNALKHYKPEIQIELMGNSTGVELHNLSIGNNKLTLSNLNTNEIIYINNETKQIVSNLAGAYRLSSWNKQPLILTHGINNIRVSNKCKITIRNQFPILI